MTRSEPDSATSTGQPASAGEAAAKTYRGTAPQTAREGSRVDWLAVPSRKKHERNRNAGAGLHGVVEDRGVGSVGEVNRETRRDRTVFMAKGPEEPPGGSQSVHNSNEVG
jgi:hypothetical protein